MTIKGCSMILCPMQVGVADNCKLTKEQCPYFTKDDKYEQFFEKAKQEVASNMLEDFLKLIALTYDKWVFKSELEDTEKEIVMDLFQNLDTTELKKKYIGE